jgi:hypothetical protein
LGLLGLRDHIASPKSLRALLQRELPYKLLEHARVQTPLVTQVDALMRPLIQSGSASWVEVVLAIVFAGASRVLVELPYAEPRVRWWGREAGASSPLYPIIVEVKIHRRYLHPILASDGRCQRGQCASVSDVMA